MIPESVRRYLENADVIYRVCEHPLAVGAAHLAEALGVSGHRVVKSLLVRAGGDRLLAAVPASARLDLRAISALLGAPAELAPEEEQASIFDGCELGAEPPFGKLWQLPLVVDVTLARPGPLYLRGGTHEVAIAMEYVEFADLEDPLVAAISDEGQVLAGGFAEGALGGEPL